MQLPQKTYFRIGEVARILSVAPHVIRFWETEFKSLRPQKSGAGQRVYTRRDVERLATIRRLLKDERYTIEGARKHLREKGVEPCDVASSAAPVDRTESLRAALVSARSLLTVALDSLDGAGPRN